MKTTLAAFALTATALAGCMQSSVPDSGAGQGVGFGDYGTYLRAQEAQAAATPQATDPNYVDVSGLGIEGTGASTAAETQTAAVVEAPVDPNAPVDPTSLSDEQSFAAVAERETIESDAARIAANRDAYEQVDPTPLPDRPAGATSSIVDFALSTTNSVGQPLYSRSVILAESRYNRNCAKFPSPDLAQEEFLSRGGPKRDPLGLDPDGDGFACAWDPRPFRLAVQG